MDSLSATLSTLKLDANSASKNDQKSSDEKASESKNEAPMKRITILKRPKEAATSDADATKGLKEKPHDASSKSSPEKCGPDEVTSEVTTQTASHVTPLMTLPATPETAEADADDGKSRVNPDSAQNKRRRGLLQTQRMKRDNVFKAYTNEGSQESKDIAKSVAQRRPRLLDVQPPDGVWSDDWGLMEAEWLQDIPLNFEGEWLVMPCPVGKRCSVWALDGESQSYTKQGYFLQNFESALPNGHHNSYWGESTFLDCVYNESLATYFIIDCLQWQDYDLRDCDTEARFYWLNTKLSEFSPADLNARTKARITQYMLPLPVFPCTGMGMQKALSWLPLPTMKLEIDGILMFHKSASYTSGETPLIAWMKPWMADEIFSNIQLPKRIKDKKPYMYKDYVTYMKEWNEKEARKKSKASLKVGRKSFSNAPTRTTPSTATVSLCKQIVKDPQSVEKLDSSPEAGDDGETAAKSDADVVDEDAETSKGAEAAAKSPEHQDEDAALEDDPELKLIASVANQSENRLLSLIGDNMLDTFAGARAVTKKEDEDRDKGIEEHRTEGKIAWRETGMKREKREREQYHARRLQSHLASRGAGGPRVGGYDYEYDHAHRRQDDWRRQNENVRQTVTHVHHAMPAQYQQGYSLRGSHGLDQTPTYQQIYQQSVHQPFYSPTKQNRF